MPRSNPDVDRILCSTGIGLLSFALLLELWFSYYPWLNWSDRDLVRSMSLASLPTAGAEMNYGTGARVPGGAYHALLALPMALGVGPDGVFRILQLMEVGAVMLLFRLVSTRWGALAALWACLAYVSSSSRDATAVLWNPTALPLLMMLSHAALFRIVETDERRYAFGWGFCLAIATSAHLSAGLWTISCLIGAAILVPSTAARAAGPALLGFAIPYIPYAATEWMAGLPNTQLIMEQGPVRDGARWGLGPTSLATVVDLLLPSGDISSWAAKLTQLIGIAAATVAARAVDHRDHIRLVLFAVACVVLVPAADAQINLKPRYLVCAIGGWSLLIGAGLTHAMSRLGSLARVGITLSLGLPVVMSSIDLTTSNARPDFNTWSWQQRTADRLRAQSLPGAPADQWWGRWAILQWDSTVDGATLLPTPAHYTLRRQGLEFPGSLEPPCFATLLQGPDNTIGSPELADVFGVSEADITIMEHTSDSHGIVHIAFDLRDGLCPTSASNRYLDTAQEASFRAVALPLGEGQVARTDVEDGDRFVFHVDDPDNRADWTLYGAIDLHQDSRGVRAILRSNQLRGYAFNGGWLANAMARSIRIVLENANGNHEIPIHQSPVGLTGVVPPLRTGPVHIPPGIWTVRLEATGMLTPYNDRRWSSKVPTPTFDIRMQLTDRYEVRPR